MGTGKIPLSAEEAAIMKEWQEITAARKKAEMAALDTLDAEAEFSQNFKQAVSGTMHIE